MSCGFEMESTVLVSFQEIEIDLLRNIMAQKMVFLIFVDTNAHCFNHFLVDCFSLLLRPRQSEHVQWKAMAKIRYAMLPLFQNRKFTIPGIMLHFRQQKPVGFFHFFLFLKDFFLPSIMEPSSMVIVHSKICSDCAI